MSSAITYLCIDSPCTICGARPRLRVCAGCDAKALVTDCGHFSQPRPISAGRSDGMDLHHDYCEECADAHAETIPS
jgi:hypothetical protein